MSTSRAGGGGTLSKDGARGLSVNDGAAPPTEDSLKIFGGEGGRIRGGGGTVGRSPIRDAPANAGADDGLGGRAAGRGGTKGGAGRSASLGGIEEGGAPDGFKMDEKPWPGGAGGGGADGRDGSDGILEF